MVDGVERTLWLWQEVVCVAVCTGLRGHRFAVNVVGSLSPEVVVSGSFDSTAKLWTVKGTHVATLAGHTASVTALEVCGGGGIGRRRRLAQSGWWWLQ
jgi:WD40 repeat protein